MASASVTCKYAQEWCAFLRSRLEVGGMQALVNVGKGSSMPSGHSAKVMSLSDAGRQIPLAVFDAIVELQLRACRTVACVMLGTPQVETKVPCAPQIWTAETVIWELR